MSEKMRSRAQGWVTRLSTKLDDLCNKYGKKTFNIVEINDAIEEFDNRMYNLAKRSQG